jgi:hypothetical protein
MKVQQISIFLENRAGRLDTVARLLGENEINIRALSLADTSDFGILRLIVDKPKRAADVLRYYNFTLALTDVVAVEVPDVPGGLAKVLDVLTARKINVEYMYAFVEKAGDRAALVFRFDNPDAAIAALQDGQVRLLSSDQITQL